MLEVLMIEDDVELAEIITSYLGQIGRASCRERV